MAELLLIAVAAATIDNFVLARLLGLSPVFAAGHHADPAIAAAAGLKLGLATTLALAISVGLGQQLDHRVLVPLHLPFLRILGLLAVTGVTIMVVHRLLRRSDDDGVDDMRLPMATVQSLVLGVTLLATGAGSIAGNATGARAITSAGDTLPGAIALGIGAGLGFTAVIVVIAGLQARLDRDVIPQPLRGPAIIMLTVAMMALAVLGFSGTGSGG